MNAVWVVVPVAVALGVMLWLMRGDPLKDLLKSLGLPAFLAMTTTFGFFSLLYLMFFLPIPQDSKDILFAMVGSVAAAWGGIIGYYFGSSAGSASKQAIIEEKLSARPEKSKE